MDASSWAAAVSAKSARKVSPPTAICNSVSSGAEGWLSPSLASGPEDGASTWEGLGLGAEESWLLSWALSSREELPVSWVLQAARDSAKNAAKSKGNMCFFIGTPPRFSPLYYSRDGAGRLSFAFATP